MEIKNLKIKLKKIVKVEAKMYIAFMALNLGLGGEYLLRKKLMELHNLYTERKVNG